MSLRKLMYWLCLGVLVAVTGLSIATRPALADDGGRKIKTRVAPTYPELARRMNVTGVVKVQVVIAANGTVKSTKVIGGHPLLVESSLDALRKWKYEPASDETTQTIEFKYNGNSD